MSDDIPSWRTIKNNLLGDMAHKAETDPAWALAFAMLELADNVENVADALWAISDALDGRSDKAG